MQPIDYVLWSLAIFSSVLMVVLFVGACIMLYHAIKGGKL